MPKLRLSIHLGPVRVGAQDPKGGVQGQHMKKRLKWWGIIWIGIVAAGAVGLSQCAATGHPAVASALGSPSSSTAMLREVEKPGPLELETVVSAEWVVERGQIINLDHPKAKQAGLEPGDEPIQVYFHALRHPVRGLFLVDTGVERALAGDRGKAAFRGFIATFMRMDQMKVVNPLGDWLQARGGKLAGVLFTHLHLDHVTGLPDVPKDTPLYAGPTEAGHRDFINAFSRSGMDRSFEGRPPLYEWAFRADPDNRFDGVIDVFGDGSLFAIYGPGHTTGSTAYLARTTKGPVLLTGDTASTAFGWEHAVEAGSFTADHARDAKALARLHKLVEEHPSIAVRLGHQLPRR